MTIWKVLVLVSDWFEIDHLGTSRWVCWMTFRTLHDIHSPPIISKWMLIMADRRLGRAGLQCLHLWLMRARDGAALSDAYEGLSIATHVISVSAAQWRSGAKQPTVSGRVGKVNRVEREQEWIYSVCVCLCLRWVMNCHVSEVKAIHHAHQWLRCPVITRFPSFPLLMASLDQPVCRAASRSTSCSQILVFLRSTHVALILSNISTRKFITRRRTFWF